MNDKQLLTKVPAIAAGTPRHHSFSWNSFELPGSITLPVANQRKGEKFIIAS